MFDLGIQELVVIFVVVLLVFGPKKLPELARTMGKAFGQLRRAMFDIKAEVEREMQEDAGKIKHDLPDWKKDYPVNKTPSEDKTEDVKASVQKENEDIPPSDATDSNVTVSAKDSESETKSATNSSTETRDS